MDPVAHKRMLSRWVGAGFAAMLLLVAATPAARADGSAENYRYHVAAIQYQGSGQLTGGRLESTCTPAQDALWEGDESTSVASQELEPLTLGTSKLEVHGKGSEGFVVARDVPLESTFNANYSETTACAPDGTTEMFSTHSCTDKGESSLDIEVGIKGKVGRKLSLDWSLSTKGGLVPNEFTCVTPYTFPTGSGDDCDTKSSSASLNQFTGKIVRLPFRCFYSTTTPPLNSHYTRFSAVSEATGSILLRRIKHKG